MSREYPTPSPDDVVAALEKTGFLFEQRMARLLGDDVSTGWAFEDPDSAASREIDIHLSRSTLTYGGGRGVEFGWTLLGECKDFKHPWVVLVADHHPDGEAEPHSEVFLSEAARDNLGATHHEADYIGGGLRHFDVFYSACRLWPVPRAVQLLTLSMKKPDWETHGGDIYHSVTYPLAKAVAHLTRQQTLAASALGRASRVVCLYFPVLIVSSPIFAVRLADDGAPTVQEVDHVTLERVIASESVRGKFRIDVVHANAVTRWRSEFIPAVLQQFADRLGIDDDVDNGVVDRLTRLHVPTIRDQADAAETRGGWQ